VWGTLKKIRDAASELLREKLRSPLETIASDNKFCTAVSEYDECRTAVSKVNAALQIANTSITAKKREVEKCDLKAAEAELAHLLAITKRHEASIVEDCARHIALELKKVEIDEEKIAVRAKLESHSKSVVTPYENRINDYLDRFNAGFRIAETKHTYPGGIATSSYQLVINNTGVELGDGRTPTGLPSFKNTLSAGDRMTLALAFFLSNLERDPLKAQKIVVFDDPFSSQDAFRRRQTIHEIRKVGQDCAQVIVLSHDAGFLKQLWEKVSPSDRVGLAITDGRALGVKIHPIDLEKACQGRVATEIDDLQAYLATGAGKPLDLIKKMRVVLETYCRTTYPAYFASGDWLGDMVRKTREADETHPAKPLYDELDQINDYSATYHHGEDAEDATTEEIDTNELTGFVRRTLRIVNSLQA
jgi:hypothetical protein